MKAAEGGSGPSRLQRRTPAVTPAPASALRAPRPAPPLHALRRRSAGQPASPDGMPTAMLPYACVLVLLGGRCPRPPPPARRLSSGGRELAVGLSLGGPQGLLWGPAHGAGGAAPRELFLGLPGQHLPLLRGPSAPCAPAYRVTVPRALPSAPPCCVPSGPGLQAPAGPPGGPRPPGRCGRTPGPLKPPWEVINPKSLRSGLQDPVLPTES